VSAEGPYSVRAGVYNEAGELVRVLFTRTYSQEAYDLALSLAVIGSLNGPDREVTLSSGGVPLGTWDGSSGTGDPVTNGVYHVKLDIADDFGTVSTVTRQVMVSRNLTTRSLSVFNSAGEMVRSLEVLVDDGDGVRLTGLTIGQKALRVGMGDPTALSIVLSTTAGSVTLSWDGKNGSGREVDPGHYHLEARWEDGQGGTQAFSQGLLVQDGGKPSPYKIEAYPNLLSPANGHTAVFALSPSRGSTLSVKVHTLAGEKVGSVEGPRGADSASWDASNLASGLYLASVEVHDDEGSLQEQRLLKIAVLR
jgi:hypothetical protein